MTEDLSRDHVIELLERLGSEDDAEVLEAARQMHARLTAAGLTWDELLAPDDDEDYDEDYDEDEYEDGEDEDDTEPEAPAATAEDDAEALKLIDKLLARPGISDDFRDELEGYKADIAEGEFDDHRYLRALYKRLNK